MAGAGDLLFDIRVLVDMAWHPPRAHGPLGSSWWRSFWSLHQVLASFIHEQPPVSISASKSMSTKRKRSRITTSHERLRRAHHLCVVTLGRTSRTASMRWSPTSRRLVRHAWLANAVRHTFCWDGGEVSGARSEMGRSSGFFGGSVRLSVREVTREAVSVVNVTSHSA